MCLYLRMPVYMLYTIYFFCIENISASSQLGEQREALMYVFRVSLRRVLLYDKYGLDICITTCDLFQKCFGCRRASFALSQWKWHVSASESINLDSLCGRGAKLFPSQNRLLFSREYLKSINIIALIYPINKKLFFILCNSI